MKNKEIEELLNNIKDKYSYEPYDNTGNVYTIISYEEGQLLSSYIERLENNRDKAIKYVENMPYLQETDKEYEDINGHTYFTYKEWDDSELLNILKGDSK